MENNVKELIHDEMSEKIIAVAEKIALTSGAQDITVRRILLELGITNRVFYNRFHNLDEVLKIVYRNTVLKIRETMEREFDNSTDFFQYVTDLVASSLIASYDNKMKFAQYVFEHDSVSDNYEWWTEEIKKLVDFAKSKKYIRDVDSGVISYAIWCFCRGYNADAVGRNLPKEEAVENFRYSFAFLLEGLKRPAEG